MRTKTLAGLTTMLCLLAVGATSASAANYFPTAEPGPERAFEVKGGESTFTIGKASIKCKESVFTGKTPPKTGSSSQTFVPNFKGCVPSIGSEATFTNERCAIEYYSQILISPGVYAEFTGFIENGGTCHMKFRIFVLGETCEVTIQSQKELKGSEQTNLKPAGLEVKSGVVGIVYKVTPLCELAGVTGGSEGKYTGLAKTAALFIE